MIDPNNPFKFKADTESRPRPPFVPGEYTFRITDYQAVTVKDDPRTQASITVLDANGRTIGFNKTQFSESWQWKTDQFAASLGIYPDEEGEYELPPTVIIGMEGRARFKTRVADGGAIYPEVATFLPAHAKRGGF
jgi:hypothetical protein